MDENWIEKLIRQYADESRHLDDFRRTLDEEDLYQQDKREIVSGMLSDLRFSLDWMRRGRRPGTRRGIDRTNVYRQRELMAELRSTSSTLGIEDERKLVMTLLSLSDRERQCFLLHWAHGLTYAEISARLKVSRATVQRFVERARDKVKQDIS